MKIQELRDELDERDVEYDPKAKKAELEALYEEVLEDEEGEEPEEEAPELEEVEEEALAEESADEYAGLFLGKQGIPIDRTEDYSLNGREYKRVYLTNGSTMILSEKDLEEQLSDK